MKLNLDTLTHIIGENKDVIVYGFTDCAYTKLYIDLINLKYNVRISDKLIEKSLTNPHIKYKTILANMLIENHKRSLKQEPLIYLLFCVAYKTQGFEKNIDLHQLAHSHAGIELAKSVTDTELRRCYRLYAESTPEIKKLIEQTFKFIRINKDKNTDSYCLEEIAPFWENSAWESLWQERKLQTKSKQNSAKIAWRPLFWQQVHDANQEKHADLVPTSISAPACI